MALSHRARVAKKKLQRQIMSAFGARVPINRAELELVRQDRGKKDIDTQIASQADSKIQKMFYSKRNAPYPINQAAHEFSKMPRETVHNFVPLQKIVSRLGEIPQIMALIESNPRLKGQVETLAQRATRERGIKASKFWSIVDKGYIDRIAAAGKGNPNKMNQVTGEKIARLYGSAVVPRTHIDIGTFAGGTALEIAKALSPQQRKLFKVVLVDVAGDIVKKYAVPSLVAEGVPRENIRVIPSSFYNAAVSLGTMPKPLHEKGEKTFRKEFTSIIGKVDSISAGAATINFATDLRPYLKSIKRLLKNGGMFVNWDWGSAEVRSPSVNVEALKRTSLGVSPEGKRVTHYDAYVSFLNFWMRSYGYSDAVVDRMIKDMNSKKQFDFIQWIEKNRVEIENARQTEKWVDKKTGKEMIGRPGLAIPFGYRNRAYRTGESMRKEALRLGLQTPAPIYPIAEPGKLSTGNVNWMLTMRKS